MGEGEGEEERDTSSGRATRPRQRRSRSSVGRSESAALPRATRKFRRYTSVACGTVRGKMRG